MTPSKLWGDYDPKSGSLDAECVFEETDGEIIRKKYLFTSEKTDGGEVRVLCSILQKKDGAKNSAVLYAADLFKGADKELILRLANDGSLVAVIEFMPTETAPSTVYRGEFAHGKPNAASERFLKAEPSARHTSWFIWAKMIRRAAVFVGSVLGIDDIILAAENTSSTAAYMAAGSDSSKTFKGVVSIFGCGYTAYRGLYKYSGKSLEIDEERQTYISGIEAQTYVKFLSVPSLMLLSTNSEFGDLDRGMDLFDMTDGDKTLIISPNLRDRITAAAADNLIMWLNRVFDGGEKRVRNPQASITVSEDKYYFNLKAPDFDGIESVGVYYSVTNELPYFREWKSLKAEEVSGGEYIAKIDVDNPAIIFAFANISYKGGEVVSSKCAAKSFDKREPQARTPSNRIIYSTDTGVTFVPSSKNGLIAEENIITLAEGAYSIKGVTSSEGAMINYGVGTTGINDDDAAAIVFDAYTARDVEFSVNIYKSAEEGLEIYTCRVALKASDEWRKTSLSPRMFLMTGNGAVRQADGFGGIKMLEIEGAREVVFNNVLFV
jgi:hypothetical protein